MKLSFYGAAREVTGSKHLLTINGKNILLDCGIFQGHRQMMMSVKLKFLSERLIVLGHQEFGRLHSL